MSKRNLDQLIGDLNSLYQDIDVPTVDTKKLAKEYYEKKLREQKGNYRNMIVFAVIGLSIVIITPKDIYSLVNMGTFFIFLSIAFLLNLNADKKMKSINRGQSFIDYKNNKNETTKILIHQYKLMRNLVYPAALIPFSSLAVQYYHNRDSIDLLVTFPIMLFGLWYAVRALNSGIKEFEETITE